MSDHQLVAGKSVTVSIDPASEPSYHPATRGRPLDLLNPPLTVAVIGASPDHHKIGNVLVRNLIGSRGVREVHPVNPRHRTVEGLKCYSRIGEVPGPVRLAVVATPAVTVPDLVGDCVNAGVEAVIVVSSGFSETGAEGRKLEDRLARVLEARSTRLLGPNTLGYIVPSQDLDVVFLEKECFPLPDPGPLGVISQSGSLGVDVMHELQRSGNGISAFISLGNKLDINECDAVEHLGEDDDTRSMLIYIESVSDGRRLARTLGEYASRKPIVLLYGGKSGTGRAASSLHTGRLGGEYGVLKGLLDQTGAIQARDEVDLVDLGRCMSMLGRPAGGAVLVITNGGGNGIVAADLIEASWSGVLRMTRLRPSVEAELASIMPSYIRPGNPVDLSAEATEDDYLSVLRAVLGVRACDVVLLGMTANERLGPGTAHRVGDVARETGTPVVAYLKGMSMDGVLARRLGEEGVPCYPSIRRAVDSLGTFVRWHRRHSLRRQGGDDDAA